jgi:hypothetical protein
MGQARKDPRSATAWATPARGGGSWAPGGLATDGRSIFAATGNTFGATDRSGGEAILRFTPGPTLADWFAPSDWKALDAGDVDIGGLLHGFDGDTGAELVAVPVGAARRFNAPIATGGRIFVAVDGGVVALAPGP